MNINVKSNLTSSFGEVKVGEVFLRNGAYFMKAHEVNCANAVDLDAGFFAYFEDYDDCIVVKHELNIL